MTKPEIHTHQGVHVVRDDLYPGGTKSRYIIDLFDGVDELVYASPAEGGAQYALAHCAQATGKKATIFVAKRKTPHPRAYQAKALGATVRLIKPGYLTVVQARARQYCEHTGASLVPFGAHVNGAIDTIAKAALSTGIEPDEVWCAAGSGVLSRGLAKAFPDADRHVVQIGRKLEPHEVAGATIHMYPKPFSKAVGCNDFPSDPHYDAKAWHICAQKKAPGKTVLFWNVTGPAD